MSDKRVHYEDCASVVQELIGQNDCDCSATADRDALHVEYADVEAEAQSWKDKLRFVEAKLAIVELERDALQVQVDKPIPMILFCPACGRLHVDEPDERTPGWTNPPHKSHLCHGCKHIWRPCDRPTEGVKEIETTGKADSPKLIYPSIAEQLASKDAELREARQVIVEVGHYVTGGGMHCNGCKRNGDDALNGRPHAPDCKVGANERKLKS